MSLESTYTSKEISVAQLRAAIAGRVITPEDTEYDAARTVFYGGIDRRPAVIVRAANAADVSHVVSLARESGMELAVRSGGHSVAGHSVSHGGIVLDLSAMKGLDIDVDAAYRLGRGGPDSRRIHHGGGGTWPGDRVRRHRLGRHRGNHPGRWRRISCPQVRPDHR